MCNNCTNEVEVIEYINTQTGEKLDLERVNQLKDNAMLKARPDLWCEWDFEKNDELGFDIWKMTKGDGKNKPLWTCSTKHPYDASAYHKVKGSNCPYCSNHRLLVGFNDMWTTNPELAKLLHSPEDGYKYMQWSNLKVDWKCPCGEIIKNKKISDINKQGLPCKKCAEKTSFPEKVLFNMLKSISITPITEKTFNWSNNRRYDFYVIHKKEHYIIETHGLQHYKNISRAGARTLKEEQANDKYKYELAIVNGIKPENYIEIDCRKSDFNFIKNNIISSRLAEIFNLSDVDWNMVIKEAQTSIKVKILEMHKDGLYGKDIAIKLGINRTTVYSTLKNYGVNTTSKNQNERYNIGIYQLDTNMNLISEWRNFQEIEDNLGFSKFGIKNNCLNKTELSHGYKWMYKEDYDKYINGEIYIKPKKNNTSSTPIFQLSLDGVFIRKWDNMFLVEQELDINRFSLKRAIDGLSKISHGYKWTYLSEYNILLNK